MEQLSTREEAFIRPSPSSGSLGGVADKTREAMLVCEAAGFDIVIVETVGVGQSETAVAGMTDVFVLLQLPNAGDDLQAIKKGIVELADVVVFNKVDIDIRASEMAVAQMQSALALLRPPTQQWKVPGLQISATRGEGIKEFWETIENYRKTMEAHGAIAARRQQQALAWMWHLIETGLQQRFNDSTDVKHALPALTQAVQAGSITPATAARQLLGSLSH
jgi:LAO/AO transport system kinase